MLQTVLLIFTITVAALAPLKSEALFYCDKVYAAKPVNKTTRYPLMEVTWQMIEKSEGLGLFGSSKRARRKERGHIEKDLRSVEKEFEAFLVKRPEFRETLKLWREFNEYWSQKAEEFLELPQAKQKQLREVMEVPFSIGIKHLISFLEAGRLQALKRGRLHAILETHKKHPEVDIETALFHLNRTTSKYYSRWDILRCKF